VNDYDRNAKSGILYSRNRRRLIDCAGAGCDMVMHR
jgi:hypothetical protein